MTYVARWKFPQLRRWLVAPVVAALLTTLVAGCTAGATAGPGSAPVIGLTYVPNIQFSPFYVAESKGLFPKDAGAVTLRHHGSSEGLFTALTTGQEQFVIAGGDEILQARAQGVDVVAVATYYSTYPVRVIVPQDSPIQTVADLKGRTVGLPGRFGENWIALLVGLQKIGYAVDKDVAIAEIGYTQQAALVTGKVDAVVGFANSDVVSFQQAGFPVRAIDLGTPLVSICVATTGVYADAHPDVVRGVVGGVAAGIQSVLDDPDGALAVSAGFIPDFSAAAAQATAKQVLLATSALFVDASGYYAPMLDPAQWTAMGQAMAGAGLIGADVDARQALRTGLY